MTSRGLGVKAKTWDVQTKPLLDESSQPTQATFDVQTFHHAQAQPIEEPRSRLQRLCRAFGIELFYQLIYQKVHPDKKFSESKKIAIREDRRMAIFAGSIHFIPIAATAIICGLNLSGYYIGGELAGISNEDDEKFIGLQFGAKLHELTVNASLTAIIFSFVRYQLAFSGGLPFGALFTGLQFRDISFLWSMELWGAARAHYMRLRTRLAVLLLVVVCAFLSVSVGSASATLMRPRLDYWPAGGTDFWVGIPPAELLSTNVTSSQVPDSCLVDSGDPSCPYADWQTIAQSYLSYYLGESEAGYFPLGFYIQGAKAVRYLTAQPRVDTPGAERLCVATVPSSSVGDALIELAYLYRLAAQLVRREGKWRFWSWQSQQQTVAAYQPIVHARCLQVNASSYSTSTSSQYHYDNGTIPFYSLADLEYYNQTGDFPIIGVPVTDDFHILLQNANTSSVPQVAWATMPQQSIDNPNDPHDGPTSDPALGAMLSIPANADYGAMIYICTIDSRLAPASVTSLAQAVVGGEPDTWWNLATYGANNTYPRILIDYEWAKYLNPVVTSDNSTAIQSMLNIANLWDVDQVDDDLEDAQHKVESLLATLIANGLARRDYGRELAGTLVGDPDGLSTGSPTLAEWAKQMMPSHGRAMGPGGNAFSVTSSDQQNSTKFTMHTTVSGYAYSSQGFAAQFSMFVLLLHALLAVSHWIYMTWSKQSSSSWDSIAELVALAMNSRRSEVFENTGAGIDDADLFKNQTRVVQREGHLELVVGNSPAGGTPVKANDVYG